MHQSSLLRRGVISMIEPIKLLLVGRARDALDARVQRSLSEQVVWAEAATLAQAADLLMTESYAAIVMDAEDPAIDFAAAVEGLSMQAVKPGLVLISEPQNTALETIRATTLALSVNVLATLSRPLRLQDMQTVVESLLGSGAMGSSEPLLTEAELMQGLVSNGLSPIFQPKVNLQQLDLVEAETYARWMTASGATLGADTIVKLAKAAGHMSVLTYRMLELSVIQQRQWAADGIDLAMCVNIPGDTLYRDDFIEVLTGLCEQYDVDPTRLRLNITESELALDDQRRFGVLNDIKAAGFGLALDDFGAGYATLLALPSIPFDEVIIDRRFVRRAAEDHRGQIILESAISLSIQLGMRVTCEGVETAEQLALVSALGADCALGYHIGKPMAATDFLIWAEDLKAGAVTISGASQD